MTTHTPASPQPISPPPSSIIPEALSEDTQPIQPVRGAARPGLRPWLLRLPLLALTGLLLLMIMLALFVAAHEVRYAGRIYPGISSYGIDLSGLTYDRAASLLRERFTYDEQTVFTLRDGDRTWQATAAELGVSFDADQTVATAMLLGRGGGLPRDLAVQADIWLNGRSVSPVIVYDQTRADSFLQRLLPEINRAVQDASLSLQGTEVISAEGQVGRSLDIPATLGALRERVLGLEPGGDILLVINETPPQLWSVAEAEARLRAAVSGPLSLFADASSGGEAGPWTATPGQIAQMLEVQRVENPDGTAGVEVHLNPEQFLSFLNGIAPQLITSPQPARLIFNDETRQLEVLQPSINGRELNVDESLAAIEAMLFAPPSQPGATREVPLSFTLIVPPVNNNVTAADLGITGLVSEATTYYLGSSAARQQNIATAAALFNGVVIGPGEEFSFNEWLGDVSAESGFEEGFIIFGGRTIKGIGGGVCQVSTTAYQAAFYAGFPILSRVPHGYRVGYYEYGEGVGMDATVYSPLVDFRFLNDTPYYLLIETATNPANATVTFRFYSTDIGREVVKIGPRIANVQPHGPPIYEENAELAPGQTRQVEWAVDGADVAITRQVWRNGQLESEDTFSSHYLPWQDVIQVAPGQAPTG